MLTNIHNAAVHAQTVCNITETISSPLLHSLEAVITSHRYKLTQLQAENKELLREIEALKQKCDSVISNDDENELTSTVSSSSSFMK